MFQGAGVHHNLIFAETGPHQDNRGSIRFSHVLISSLILVLVVSIAAIVRAEPYEVLVVDIAGADDVARIEEFEKDAAKFNALPQKGYSTARSYFNLLHMADGQVYFVFGFRGEVQGVHRRNYPGTVKNLRRIKQNGAPKYPRLHWLPVEEIRRLLRVP